MNSLHIHKHPHSHGKTYFSHHMGGQGFSICHFLGPNFINSTVGFYHSLVLIRLQKLEYWMSINPKGVKFS